MDATLLYTFEVRLTVDAEMDALPSANSEPCGHSVGTVSLFMKGVSL